MKNSEIDIFLFGCLDKIARQHHIKGKVWAAESGLKYPARVSELRTKLRLFSQGKDYMRMGRSFDIKKCAALVYGLKSIIGGDVVKKELMRLTEKYEDRRQRLMLMIMALDDEDEEQVELYLKAIFQPKK